MEIVITTTVETAEHPTIRQSEARFTIKPLGVPLSLILTCHTKDGNTTPIK
eukprot:Awhi_evm1s11766